MHLYSVNVEQNDIFRLIELNEIETSTLNENQRINLLAITHLYISSKQTIPFTNFMFDMMTDGLTKEMELPSFIWEEVASTNGRIYFDRQVFNLVKHICKIYDKKELSKLIYYQPTDNKLFELLFKSSIQSLDLDNEIALKLATEICRFSIKELPLKSVIYLIKI